jgi:hypothetical protein
MSPSLVTLLHALAHDIKPAAQNQILDRIQSIVVAVQTAACHYEGTLHKFNVDVRKENKVDD